ncbi:MAG: pilus assembly protein [Gammaproteobacteria bacterium]
MKAIRLLALSTGLVLALSACVQTTPLLDQQFGTSMRTAVAAQLLNPQAASDTRAVIGIDGRSATAIQRHYQSSYETPAGTEAPMTTGKK